MKNIAIYGAGGFGRETALMIEQINEQSREWNITGFYDDGLVKGQQVDGRPVLGGVAEVNSVREALSIAVAIADPATRKSLVGRLNNSRIIFPTLVHPSCQQGDRRNILGHGCILTAGSIFTTGIRLNDFVIVNLLATIGHDVKIGAYTSIMPGCSISGNVQVGEGTMVGTGARILQSLSIGASCKIGAGAVVTQSFSDHKTIVGIPAYEK